MNLFTLRICGLAFSLMLSSVSIAAGPIRIATWNMNNLHWVVGEPLLEGAPARSVADYKTLQKYAKRLNADIVALQEVNGPKAARLVFPATQYDLYFAGDYIEDLATDQTFDPIYTGFAVRRGAFDAVTKGDYPALGLTSDAGHSLRWGTDLLVEKGGKRLRLLSVHLKSGCSTGRLDHPDSEDCATLAKQRAPLEAWIDKRAVEKIPFVILGDFNRAFDVHGQQDHLWGEIDDGSPPGLDLRHLPEQREAGCWRGTPNYRPNPIDFIVFDTRAWQWVKPDSFKEVTYDPADQNVSKHLPSDHCPIEVEMNL